jgi:hypothetical protein
MIPLVIRNALCVCSVKNNCPLSCWLWFENNFINLAKLLDRLLGVAQSMRAWVRTEQ